MMHIKYLGILCLTLFATGSTLIGFNDKATRAMFDSMYEDDYEGLVKALKNGADPNAKDQDGWTALHFAAYLGSLDMVKYLVGVGKVDVNVKDKEGQTALHKAAQDGKLEVVKYLVGVGNADYKAQDNFKKMAIYFAVEEGHKDVARYLGSLDY